ncbi:MAG: FAD-binding protein, partial [Lentisphaeria bacterium]|nr:FAD-binding protein [Lentisphaeria bacterium]
EGINPMATGEGQLLGIAAGAALHNMDVMLGPQIRFVPPPRPPFAQMLPTTPLAAKLMSLATGLMPSFVFQHIVKSLLVTWQHPEPMLFEAGAILINKSGQRFINELDEPAYGIPTQQDKVAWVIFDQTIAEKFSAWPHYISTAPGISYAYVKDYKRLRPDVYAEADTLAALASQIGVPAAGLEAAAAKNDGDDAFGRESFGTGLGKPPFYALGPAKGWIVITEGGLAINDKLQVLDNENSPIPGLYAGGTGAQGGMIIWGHGLHICWAVTSGRLAAENAAG